MKISRREFAARASGGLLGGTFALRPLVGKPRSRPNILLLMTDQQHIPPAYGPDEGAAQGLKEILGFRPLSPDNSYIKYFPGYLRLRQNSVVFRTHYTASAACVPSRACIMTGSYKTGVEQTDQLFKTPEEVPWLDPNGTPTIGDWFRAAGYSTHYFGKWHVSYPELVGPKDSLEAWGFGNWEKSYPEPHGGGSSNAGVYRDIGFADSLVAFLEGKIDDPSGKPWLAVGSLVNPHDNGLYPWGLPDGTGVSPETPFPPPPGIPAQGDWSLPHPFSVELNPDGFPQENYWLPRTFAETLDDKPRCQKDYSFKFGLAAFSNMQAAGIKSPYPFQMRDDPHGWQIAYDQFYMYCHYLADRQLRRILYALDAGRLTDNTIVVFLSDHGEMAGAHGGMIQKWHNAYEETIRIPMVVSSPLVNKPDEEMRVLTQPTSSIDLAPTLLGFAGFTQRELLDQMQSTHGASAIEPFVGADLSGYAKGDRDGDVIGPDGKSRAGVLFFSNDTITELGERKDDEKQYELFLGNVDQAIADGYPLAVRGPVTQPNSVRAFCTGDWKIVRYTDPNGVEQDEWELYCLKADAREEANLVDFRTGKVRHDVTLLGMSRGELVSTNNNLKKELAQQEAICLKKNG